MKNEMGLIHIYYGDGKGKTSAAVGLAVRAAGYGLKVLFVQFLKSGTSSELNILKGIENITVFDGYTTDKFTFEMTDAEKADCLKRQNVVLKTLSEMAYKYDMIVLDEFLGAIASRTIDYSTAVSFVKNKPPNTEMVLTGAEAVPELVDIADYATEMKKFKHPFDRGVRARYGIEK